MEASAHILEIRPPIGWKALYLLLGIAGQAAWFASVSVTRAEGYTFFWYCSLILVVAWPLLVLDVLQRVFRFGPNRVEVRYLFLWRVRELSGPVSLCLTPSREIELIDLGFESTIITIPWGYYPQAALLEQLETYYRKAGRYCDEESG